MFSEWTDTLLHVWPLILLSDLLRYLIPVVSLSVFLALFHDRLKHRKIQARDSGSEDRKREVFWSMSTVLIFSFVGLGIYVGEQYDVIRISAELPQFWAGAISLVFMIVVHDAYFYWAHRLMHDRRLFQRFHRLHHLSRTPRGTAAYAFAIPEALVEALFFPLYLLVIETSALVVFLFLAHMILRNVAGHAGYELFPRRWIDLPVLKLITTTTHHDLHHEGFRYNYGLYFTWWDRWMGTEHPRYRERFLEATGSVSRSPQRGVSSCIALAAMLTLFHPSPATGATHCDVQGLWVTEGFSAVVNVKPDRVDGQIFARLIWIFDTSYQHAIGESLFSSMRGNRCAWSGGKILNPENNKTYRGSVTLETDGRLKIQGCIGPFCKTQHWRRYEAIYRSLPNPSEP
ncbi:MAG: sterol desaturase family protein [Pseudomonadota bacterium]